MINGGVLARPRCTIRFMWAPESAGTRAYLERYPDETKRTGEDVTKNRNSMHLMRAPSELGLQQAETTVSTLLSLGTSVLRVFFDSTRTPPRLFRSNNLI